jgi:hypothetical protein
MRNKSIILIFLFLFISFNAKAQRYEIKSEKGIWFLSLEIAKGFNGLREKTGNNDGYWIDRFNKSVSNPRYASYCNAGQYFCFDSANKLNKQIIPVPKSGLANSTFDFAVKHGTKSKGCKVGDYLIWKFKNRINGHVERVIEVRSHNMVKTMAFNTSFGSGTAQNGNGCGYKIRYINNPLGKMFYRGLIGAKYN